MVTHAQDDDVKADQAVTRALEDRKSVTFSVLTTRVERLDRSVTPLEVRQAAWRLIGAHKLTLTDDMKVSLKK